MFRNRGRSRGPSLALLLLGHELFRAATTYGIPTVTLFAIVGQILMFLGILPISWRPHDVCISFDNIVNRGHYTRLILSQLCHGDEWHLYYNMVSFLWKGRTLENRFGSVRFGVTLAVFTVATAVTYLLLNKGLAEVTEDYNYLYHCSLGFSGVIFALKVLTTHFDASHVSHFMGFPIGSKYAVWAELVLIQMISPNASFVGHLAGIVVGLGYTYGPLKYVIEIITGVLNPMIGPNRQHYRSDDHSNTYYRRSSRSSNYSSYSPNDMSEEEQLRRAYEESLREANRTTHERVRPTAPPYPTDHNYPRAPQNPVDAETLRRLRLRRYQT